MHTKCTIGDKMEMISARVDLNEYTNKVLSVIKAKFDLKDKSEAINKFIELYGDEIVEKEPKEEYVKKVIDITNKHLEKYGKRKMSIEELDKICEI